MHFKITIDSGSTESTVKSSKKVLDNTSYKHLYELCE